MGKSRKRTTHTLKQTPQPSWTVNCSVTARNLRKGDLGGVIFGCKHNTIKECLTKLLFGLPDPHFAYVKNITPDLPIFLFNYSDRKLHGIFEAESSGQMNINPYGWTNDDAESTPYGAQVRVRMKKQCGPLLEDQFAPIIADNYYEPKLFWFELDRTQTRKLIDLFMSSTAPNNAPRLENTARWNNIFLPSSGAREATDNREDGPQDRYGFDQVVQYTLQKTSSFRNDSILKSDSEQSVLANSNFTNTQKSWSSLFKPSPACDRLEKDNTVDMRALDVMLPQSNQSLLESDSSGAPSQGEDGQLFQSWEDRWDSGEYEEPVKSSCCISSSMTAEMCQPSESSMHSNAKEMQYDAVASAKYLKENHETEIAQQFQNAEASSQETDVMVADNDMKTNSFDLQTVVAKLVEEIEVLKVSQSMQSLKINSLEQQLSQSKFQIQQLEKKSTILASGLSSSSGIGLIQEVNFELLHKPSLVDDSIVIVGGCNGSSWLSAIDSYCLSRDSMKSLSHLPFDRSFPSVTKMNGELFILGGVHGDVWYDTVESYNPSRNQWARLPSLNKKKSSLVGASLFGKIFACGGRNRDELFSEVEMFDLNIGKWILIQSMHQKRFSSAAAEIDGTLYVVGGYDGRAYLNSVERFDPRERRWTVIGDMSIQRGCHSLVTLNGKLFALGGYDGSRMVSSVEVLDPRFGSWMMAEPMNDPRGYSGAVVSNGKIYIMGGENRGEILDTTECYEEGYGWQVTNLKAVGRRCGFSAVVLGVDW